MRSGVGGARQPTSFFLALGVTFGQRRIRNGIWCTKACCERHGNGDCLALVETGLALHAQLRAFDPVQHEQRALDAPDLAECEMEPVLLAVGAERAQHRGRFQRQSFDTGRQSHHIAPVLEHDLLVDGSAHDRRKRAPPAGPTRAKTWSDTPPVSTWCTSGSNSAALPTSPSSTKGASPAVAPITLEWNDP